MSRIVIKAEGLGKQYRLGQVGTGTISHDLNRWFHKVRGKEDPYLKIGEVNDRSTKSDSDLVWALRNIDFEVKQGEVLGVIGKNGAGKSTLLKLLSRVTGPSVGSISVKGRIASLLEVGTGFHPDLTGRENIFLNGAILGMNRQEIRSKFDEIVSFSGVERYIDTPVKRYSSGMYVRLAFAVAAHLEPEILIVDEVLAVGDAEFQKKCLGKMKDVSGQGRTVLFVSHQLGMIKSLCNKGMVLANGQQAFHGSSHEAIDFYINQQGGSGMHSAERVFEDKPGKDAQLLNCALVDKNGKPCLRYDVFDEVYLTAKLIIRKPMTGMNICYGLEKNTETVGYSFDTDFDESLLERREPGIYEVKVQLPNPLKAGQYRISVLSLGIANVDSFHVERGVFAFEVVEESFDPTYKSFSSSRDSLIVFGNRWQKTAYTPL